MKKVILFFVLFLYSVNCQSQQTKIFVLDENNAPVEGANVVNKLNDKIIDFKVTNAKGEVLINQLYLGNTIEVSHFSYEKKSVVFDRNSSEPVYVKLILKNTEIKEVVIQSRPTTAKIIKDTIRYNIKNVITKSDRTAEDVIKKLPGLDVDESGNVLYKGGRLSKVVIDGNEFFGKSHKMSTQNITVDMLSGIDLIENYKSINGETSKALNLKLKDEVRGKFTGEIRAGAGFEDKFGAHVNLFKFRKKGNFAIISDYNNLGNIPLSLEDYENLLNNKDNPDDNPQNNENSDTVLPQFLLTNDQKKTLENGYSAIQLNEKLNKKTQLYAFSIYNFSQFDRQITANHFYFGNPNLYKENFSEVAKNFISDSELRLKQNFNDKNNIYYSFSLVNSKDTSNTILQRDIDGFYNETGYKNNPSSLKQNLIWENQFSEKRLFKVYSSYESSIKKGSLENISNEQLFNLDNNFLQQNIKNKFQEFSVGTSMKENLDWGATLKLSVDISHKTNQFSDELNHIIRNYNTYSSQIIYRKNKGAFNYSVGNNFNTHSFTDKTITYYNPQLSLKYHFISKNASELMFDYSRNQELLSLQNLANFPVYYPDRSLKINIQNQIQNFTSINQFSLSYINFGVNSSRLIFPIVSYSFQESNFDYDVYSNSQFRLQNYIPVTGKKTLSVGFYYDDRFLKNKLIVKHKFNFSKSRFYNKINGIVHIQDYNSFKISQNWVTRFTNKNYNIEFGNQVIWNKVDSNLFSTWKQFWYKNQLSVNYILGNFNCSLQNEMNYNQSNIGKSFFYNKINLNSFYKKEDSKFEFFIKVNNLLNIKKFTFSESRITNTDTEETTYSALPGYVITGIIYHF